MQKLIAFFSLAVVAISCNNKAAESSTETTGKADSASTKPALPYTASYSSSFEMGNDDFTGTILQGSWKDWENNTMDNMKSWVADTIVAFHSDNSVIRGADSLQARWKRGRAEYTSVLDTIQAVMPVYSKDKKENWVLVWAKEINTKANGTKDTMYLQETWRINKDGKADMLLQFDRAKRKK
ncbi:MAG: hypothetical protein ABIN01_17545 [Ferruginibacter sp.]